MSGPTRGPNVPHRTSRSRALEIGTDRAGFADQGPEFDPTAGVPSDVAGGHATSTPPPAGATPSSTPISNPSPFKLGTK